jgi:Ca-activated chloride channel family protein
MKTRYPFLFVAMMACLLSQAQKSNKAIQNGNDLYRLQKYKEAAAQYNKAIILDPPNTKASFNLANSLFRDGKKDEAIKTFTDLPGNSRDPALRSKAYYNKGVILSTQKKLEESIEAYKNALRQNPNDTEARENLQKALLELKKKEPPKKQDDQDKKKKKEQQQQQQQKQPKMSPKEAEQRLKLLEQKEKEVQERINQEKANTGTAQGKDW